MGGRKADGRTKEREDSLGHALKGFLQASGLEAFIKYPRLAEAWEALAGPELAEHARVFSFRRGILEIAVSSSALLNEVEFRRSALLQAMQECVKKPFVRRLSFVLRPLQECNSYDGQRTEIT